MATLAERIGTSTPAMDTLVCVVVRGNSAALHNASALTSPTTEPFSTNEPAVVLVKVKVTGWVAPAGVVMVTPQFLRQLAAVRNC